MTADRQQPNRPARPQMVDLFAGPGGLDVAARWLGIEVHGIEWDTNACSTREKAGLTTTEGDVRDYGPESFPSATILTGGPPCQTYTVAGGGAGRRALDQVLEFVKRMASAEKNAEGDAERQQISDDLKQLDDERTGLVLEPLRWALAADRLGHPYQTIVLEQVPAVLPVWSAMCEALEAFEYRTTCGILHTEEFGVPQTRRRAILIARREIAPTLPKPTHRRFQRNPGPRGKSSDKRTDEQALFNPLKNWVSMGSALKDTRKGPFTVISNYGTGGDPKARGRRSSDQPAATVTGKISRNRLVDAREKDLERLDRAEAGLLQTFPYDYPWSGGDIAQQIGNAIPPRLAVHVLAAALGIKVTDEKLDNAVRGNWATTSNTHPLNRAEVDAEGEAKQRSD